jgi:hypothetical protein
MGAIATGFFFLSIAAFIHLHWFWTASPRFWGYAQLGKIIAVCAAVAALATLVYAVRRDGQFAADNLGGSDHARAQLRTP